MFIYLITNKINNKKYVGQTINFNRRMNNHFSMGRKASICPISLAIKKYGKDNFKVEILFEQKEENLNLLNELEKHYIQFLNTLTPFGYNVLPGGSNSRKTEEVKRKISQSKIGLTPWNKGKKMSPTKRLGCKFSLEHKENIRLSRIGKKHTEEQKIKISSSLFGKRLKPIKATHLITNEVIYFQGIKFAINAGFIKKRIHDSLKGKQKHHRNYRWEYILDNVKELTNE